MALSATSTYARRTHVQVGIEPISLVMSPVLRNLSVPFLATYLFLCISSPVISPVLIANVLFKPVSIMVVFKGSAVLEVLCHTSVICPRIDAEVRLNAFLM